MSPSQGTSSHPTRAPLTASRPPHPPFAPQTRCLNYTATTPFRAFASDAVATDDTADAWAKVRAAVVTDEGQRAVAQLQKMMGDIRDEVSREAKPMAPIDWNALKARSGFPEIVDQFKSGLDGVKYPAYDGKELEETAAVFKKLVAEAEKLAEEAKKREIEIEAELKAIEEDKQKLATITMDEVFEREPALKAEVDERIRNDQWF